MKTKIVYLLALLTFAFQQVYATTCTFTGSTNLEKYFNARFVEILDGQSRYNLDMSQVAAVFYDYSGLQLVPNPNNYQYVILTSGYQIRVANTDAILSQYKCYLEFVKQNPEFFNK